MLRAAELFFAHEIDHLRGRFDGRRPGDRRNSNTAAPSPLTLLLGMNPPRIDLLSEDNAASYWERSDQFDLALDHRQAPRTRGSHEVIERVHHLLASRTSPSRP